MNVSQGKRKKPAASGSDYHSILVEDMRYPEASAHRAINTPKISNIWAHKMIVVNRSLTL